MPEAPDGPRPCHARPLPHDRANPIGKQREVGRAHLHERDAKVAAYRNVRASLAPSGALVSGDAFVPAAQALAEPVMRRWAAHLVHHGDTEARAYERFAEWAHEDRYFGIDDELDMLREAGFSEVELRWRRGPIGVLLARR